MSKFNEIALDLMKRTAAYVPDFDIDGAVPATAEKPWRNWLKAELGFRNHWYPTEASRNIRDGEHKAIKLLGEDILYLRRAGRLYAIENRCSHRGTRFSQRPVCYTDDTITCWHHAFTFNLDDGRIRCLLNDPESSLAGRKGIKSYPVREEKGVIFTFVGDMNPPPPLEHDVPPGFFDEDVAICVADPYLVQANWRLGSEGGYDPGHHYIHNWSKFSINSRIPMTFGWVSKKEAVLETSIYELMKNGPKGFTRLAAETNMSMTAKIPGRNGEGDTDVILPIAKGQSPKEIELLGQHAFTTEVGEWLPCGLKVNPWPFPGVVHNEYYVPRDANSHYYFQCGWKRVENEEQAQEWAEGDLGQVRWKVPVVDDFTVQDAEAREFIHEFYASEDGWNQERTARFDIELLMWRVFAGEHCRGIQEERHTKGHFKR